jgi:hypothetical protein
MKIQVPDNFVGYQGSDAYILWCAACNILNVHSLIAYAEICTA